MGHLIDKTIEKRASHEAVANAVAVLDTFKAQQIAINYDKPNHISNVSRPVIYERYLNKATGENVIIPLRPLPSTKRGTVYSPMPPIIGAKITRRAPKKLTYPQGGLPPLGQSAGKGLVWSGHLQRCVDEHTGDVWYVPVVYVVSAAALPNNKPRH